MVRYVQSERLTYKYVLAELEHDIGFRQGALKLLKDIQISSTYTESKAASGLLNYWLIKNELPCYYLGQIVMGIELEKFFSSHNYSANRNQYIEQYLKDFRIDSKEIIYKLELAGFCIPSFLRRWVIEWDRDAYYADINANLISEPNKAFISADIGSHAGTEPKPKALSKMEKQQAAILKAIETKEFKPMAIPDNEKGTIKDICEKENKDGLFNAETAFNRAWKEGIGKLWQMENHNSYAHRGNN